MKIKHDVHIILANGSPFTHTAELLDLLPDGDGSCIATASCCGLVGDVKTCHGCSGAGCSSCDGKGSIKDEDTRSNYAFYDIAVKSNAEILAGIQDHVQRVAQHHAGAHKAREFMASLIQPDPSPAAKPGKVG